MDEHYFEKLLNIKTLGQQRGFNDSFHYNRYEPTSYLALDTLFRFYNINSNDSLIDFGCGKGRLNFYINYYFNAKVTGIEMNSYYFNECIKNKNSFLKEYKTDANHINFLNCFAEKYEIQEEDNKFYFFNPFSVQIFMKVIDNILLSLEKHYRNIDIILYYPSEEYIYYLENYTAFSITQEIIIDELYKNDIRQKFLIFRYI